MRVELLIILLFCHWMADYTHLSRPYMLNAKRIGSPYTPILHHSIVHGVLMAISIIIYMVIFNIFNIDLLIKCTLLQIISHFVIDVLKGKMNVLINSLSDPKNPYHWYVFGFDQFLHTIIIIIMWYMIV